MRILVTGASGFVGLPLCDALTKRSHQVTALVRRDAPNFTAFKLVLRELNAHSDCHDVLNGIDVVVHLANRAHVLNDASENPYQAYASVNVDATLNLAKQALGYGVKRFVYVSSVKVNGESSADQPFTELDTPNPEDDYGKTKFEAEQALSLLAQGSTMELVIIRPPLVYGDGVKANFKYLIKLCRMPLPLPFGAIRNRRSMIFLGNLVDFIITCIAHPNAANQTFLVSDDEDISTTALIRSIREALDVPTWLISIPQQWLVFALQVMGKASLATRLCGNLQVDISKAKTMLGWQAPFSVKQGIHHTIHNQA